MATLAILLFVTSLMPLAGFNGLTLVNEVFLSCDLAITSSTVAKLIEKSIKTENSTPVKSQPLKTWHT